MSEESIIAGEAGLSGSIIPIIIVVVIVGAALGGTYYAYDKGWIFPENDDDNVTPLENNTNNNTNNDTTSTGPKVTATFDHTWEDDDYNGQISIKEAVQFDASGSSGGKYYYWDFGDGFVDTTDSAIVTHRFNSAGIFNVTVNVANDERSDESSLPITVTIVTNPAIALNARVEPASIGGIVDNDITWRVFVQSASGTGTQISTTNLRITLNRTDSNESYFSSLVSDLVASPLGQIDPWDAGLYYSDTDISGSVSAGDNFPIAGDGGITGFPVQSGDLFSIWFIPSGEMLAQVEIPPTS